MCGMYLIKDPLHTSRDRHFGWENSLGLIMNYPGIEDEMHCFYSCWHLRKVSSHKEFPFFRPPDNNGVWRHCASAAFRIRCII